MRNCNIRTEKVFEIITSFQENLKSFSYPLDPFEIIKEKRWELKTYDSSNELFNKVSEDGFTFFKEGNYTIFYNKDKPLTRIRFTLFHEIGHIILLHHIEFPDYFLRLDDEEYFVEVEADTIARNLLAPANIIFEAISPCGNENFYAKAFNMSLDAFKIRMKWLIHDFKHIKYCNENIFSYEVKKMKEKYNEYEDDLIKKIGQQPFIETKEKIFPAYIILYMKDIAWNLSEDTFKEYFCNFYSLDYDYIDKKFASINKFKNINFTEYTETFKKRAHDEYFNFLLWILRKRRNEKKIAISHRR